MTEYKIDFKDRCNGVNINQLNGTPLYNLFNGYNGQIIDMRRLVATLNAYGFSVVQVTNNQNDTVYDIVYNTLRLKLTISKELSYQKKNEQIYIPTINILKSMSKNAKVVNNNITNINPFQNNSQPSLKVIETTKCKGVKYLPSIKKLFKDRPKLAIALCTLTAVATVAAGGFIVKTAVDRAETQKYLDSQKQVEQQTTTPSEYNLNDFIDETRKQYEMNNYVGTQNQQINNTQMEQNNQRIR